MEQTRSQQSRRYVTCMIYNLSTPERASMLSCTSSTLRHTHTHTHGVCDEPLPTHFLLLLCMYRGCHWGSGTLSVVRTRASQPRLCRRCPELSGQVQRSLHGRDLPGAFTALHLMAWPSVLLCAFVRCSLTGSSIVFSFNLIVVIISLYLVLCLTS